MALTIKIRGDASQFEKTMREVKTSVGAVGSLLGGVATGAAALTAALVGAGLAAGGVAFKLGRMAEDGSQAENRLGSIIKSMGLFGNESSKVAQRLGDLADATGLATGIDDDQILATQAKLATFKELAKTMDVVGGAFDRTTNAAIDMAAAGFGEAEQNAVQLGKALNDPVKGITALAKAGITFTAGEKTKIGALVKSHQMLKAQDMVLSAIEKQVGGTALATAKGTAQMTVAFSQLGELLGGPVAKAFKGMADSFIEKMPLMTGALSRGVDEMTARAMGFGNKVGSTLGTAISEALAGRSELFVAAGGVAFEAFKAGFIAVADAGSQKMAAEVINFLAKGPGGAKLNFKATDKLGWEPAPLGTTLNQQFGQNSDYDKALSNFQTVNQESGQHVFQDAEEARMADLRGNREAIDRELLKYNRELLNDYKKNHEVLQQINRALRDKEPLTAR